MAQFISPTGSTIVGTKEIVFARANVEGIDPATGEPIYSGDTTVFWDEQRTVRKAGKILFLDEDGDEWTFDQLKEPGEEDDEEGQES